ncbi:phospholipase D-like domain-containing protein [Tengunoibacter tsumagoiensis]|uniref:Phospholipase n=1 Tax=Tengunoibacter tsumagoiensis TaxID=2014871 RepID=A0A401ZUF5_9CHLR|nr:phospholipase D family protein [Tengunoibacter tsumagoiensis]GCE10422.1 phospholipase [Tengunoibacter tsumagoiensis]
MQNEKDLSPSSWMAQSDFSVRDTSRAAFLIDGRMTMLEMCQRFVSARQSICIAAWGMTPELLLVRGMHHRAGPDGSPAQQDLLKWLRSRNLSDEDLRFWFECEELSVLNVLRYAISKGVEVSVLLWDALSWPFATGPKQIHEQLEQIGVRCLRDDSHLTLSHPIASLHQKTIVVDDRYAFVGGIDMMSEGDGEYDRWDTKGHLSDNILRRRKNGEIAHGWHDVHLFFEGSAVADVKQNFRQRWNDVVERKQLDLPLFADLTADIVQRPMETERIPTQIVRTIPAQTYAFTPPDGIATILEAYQKAFAQAQHSIYLENQYFWRRTYLGLDTPLLGLETTYMEAFFQSLAEALRRGVVVTLILPDHPNVGREFSDDGLRYLCELVPDAVDSGTLQVYTLASSLQRQNDTYYRPIYVHAKVAIVDDQWLTLGSANLNNRGMRDDAELNVVLLQPAMAKGLRLLLMAEHLGLVNEETLFNIVDVMGRTDPTAELTRMREDLSSHWARLHSLLGDPLVSRDLLAKQAQANLQAIKQQRLLAGHLVPYIRRDLGVEYGFEVDAEKGWLSLLADAAPEQKLESTASTSNDEIAML